MKKVIKKKIVKSKKITIYKQLSILTPEELKFLNVTLIDTIDYAGKLIEEQKEVLKELERVKNSRTSNPWFDLEDTNKNIQQYIESLQINLAKINTMKGITNKLKAFEGII